APPAADTTMLSANSCRRVRPRLAPSAARLLLPLEGLLAMACRFRFQSLSGDFRGRQALRGLALRCRVFRCGNEMKLIVEGHFSLVGFLLSQKFAGLSEQEM